ncbi:MAG: beta-ketoacyl-ACP synthase II [Chloroflexi bacterium]|nr:beta-ketoacyl-ACP synthase II [Chloroflexota bacterium]MBV9134816.1 beta-ketoacyl-ACP synthase II [Chloroflexota bacterium]MBV9896408.1 beta-ketoacyl-ACP synthase II [Chloroflexota bacterium]
MAEPRRVVVTGLGAVSPVGNCVAEAWSNLLAGCSGIDTITLFDPTPFEVRIGGEVKNFKPEEHIPPKELRHMDRGSKFALVAAKEAFADARVDMRAECPERVGVIFGTAAGGVEKILTQQQILLERGPDRVSPMFLPHFLPDSGSGLVAIMFGAEGPNMAVASACATGSHAVGEALKTIQRDDADVMIAGGTEASILPVIYAGFINMRALSARNADPKGASRPFDADRDGFVISEGAAVLILEEAEHAERRGARIYAEVVGYGSGNDAWHMVQPRDQGAGAAKVMRAALRDAQRSSGMLASDVGYINPHGTSTPYNDRFESAAIKDVFGEHAPRLAVSSTKSMTGHMFGAAGAMEALVCVKTLETGWLPPTINYQTPDPECDLDYVPNKARQWTPTAAMSNSFGLGGHNSSVVFRTYQD